MESFRRIVRYQVQTLARALSALELRTIMRNKINIIEINQLKAYVAAFSLYLALLHYQKSPDILAQIETPEPNSKPLPHLICTHRARCDEEEPQDETHYQVIFNTNAFALTADEKKELAEQLVQKKVFAGRANHKRLLDAGLKLDVERAVLMSSWVILLGLKSAAIYPFYLAVIYHPWLQFPSHLPIIRHHIRLGFQRKSGLVI